MLICFASIVLMSFAFRIDIHTILDNDMIPKISSEKWKFLFTLLTLAGCLFYLQHVRKGKDCEVSKDKRAELFPNPLDGCLYVYLDMGTNVGVQIR